MSTLPEGSFSFYSPYISSISHKDPTSQERYAIAHANRLEYRGEGANIDRDNIYARARDYIHQNKLSEFSIFVNIAEKVANTENDAYNKAPIRYFRSKDGKDISPELQTYLTEMLEEADWNLRLQAASRYAALEGTILMLPQINPEDGRLMLIEESPSDISLEVTPSATDPTKAYEVCYKQTYCNDEQKVTLPDGRELILKSIKYEWDTTDVTITYNEGEGNEIVIGPEPHGFKETLNAKGGMPFAVLRYKFDARRFWGPVDGSIYSICQQRSFLMADTIMRTQSSLFEILVAYGYAPAECAAIMQTKSSGKVIPAEFDVDEKGNPLPGSKKFEYVSPKGTEPATVLDIWDRLFKQFLTMRGHNISPQEFGTKNIQSYEGARLANQYLYDLRDSKLDALAKFEKALFKRAIWANNQDKTRTQIPEDTVLEIDWQPNSDEFIDAADKVAWYTFAKANGIMSAVDMLMKEQGISRESALEIMQRVMEDNANTPQTPAPIPNMNGQTIVDPATQPPVDPSVEDPNPQLDSTNVDLGDPGNPYRKKEVGGKTYWTWGHSLKWYEGGPDTPPEHLRMIVQAVHAAGFKKD